MDSRGDEAIEKWKKLTFHSWVVCFPILLNKQSSKGSPSFYNSTNNIALVPLPVSYS